MGGQPADWYPDPRREHALRYWDGRQWTDQVADPVAPPAPAAPRPYIDVMMRRGILPSKQLTADEVGVRWGGTLVPYDRMTAMSFTVTKYSGAVSKTTHVVKLFTDPKEKVEMTWDGGENIFRALLTLLDQRVAPRLCDELLARITAGQVVEVGAVAVSRSGVAHRKKAAKGAPWAGYRLAAMREGFVHVAVDNGKGGSKVIASVPTGEPNAVILPRPLAECVTAFR